MIQGSSLLSVSGENPQVLISGKACILINATDSEIYCYTPANGHGKYRLAVLVGGKGKADMSDISLEYDLTLNSVSPERGSIMGGTTLTLEGSGFIENKTKIQVMLGKTPCDVLTSSETVLTCKTRGDNIVFNVDNSGSHPGKLNASETMFSSCNSFTYSRNTHERTNYNILTNFLPFTYSRNPHKRTYIINLKADI